MVSGIYRIYCRSTGLSYVGQAKNIEKRWQQHIDQLRDGTHANRRRDSDRENRLQEDWRKHGERSFQFSILERCPDWGWWIDKREAYWISKHGDYNIIRPDPPRDWWLIETAIVISIALPLFFLYCTINPQPTQQQATETTKI